MNVTLNLPPITAYQNEAIFAPERNVAIEATTKAGKTYGCILWMLHMAGKGKSGDECWWVAPVSEQAGIAYRRTVALLRSCDPQGRWWSTNKTTSYITLSNGVVLRFKSSDNPDSLYGEDVIAAVIDEASRCKEEGYHAVRSTLTATQGHLRIIGNVKGRHNWAYNLARKAESGLQGWKYAKITCYDAVKAGIIKPDEIEAAKRELPEAVFRELYEGIPSDDGSNPFGLEHIAGCVGELSSNEPVAFGVDLAKSVDWTVAIGLDDDGHTSAFHRWQLIPWPETTSRLCDIVGSTQAKVDSTGVGDPVLESMQRVIPSCEGFKFTSQSKQQLMEGLAVAIQNRCVVFPDGPIKNELDAFGYEYTRTGVRYTAPEGLHDDCVMALALAVSMLGSRATPFADWGTSGGNRFKEREAYFWGDND